MAMLTKFVISNNASKLIPTVGRGKSLYNIQQHPRLLTTIAFTRSPNCLLTNRIYSSRLDCSHIISPVNYHLSEIVLLVFCILGRAIYLLPLHGSLPPYLKNKNKTVENLCASSVLGINSDLRSVGRLLRYRS
jgi:hypothetical protein